ncbi:MAG: pyridine nucleotide-disulfide oxidoreductase [Moraxellaceae bacterium]|nr:MAG: pyridine nucleotide-disulfide oxidoreductase [Moraxellaceae bacterium]
MKTIVLVGGGHAHLAVLLDLASRPIPDTKVILITPEPFQWYSGMLPGLIAGQYQPDECQIDLRPLVVRAGITLVLAEVMGMDADQHCVCLRDGTRIDYDMLSLDVGSSTDTSWLTVGKHPIIPLKPIDNFVQQWNTFLSQTSNAPSRHIAVVGAGAAGVEVACAVYHALNQPTSKTTISLIGTSSGLLPGHGKNVIKRIQGIIDHCGIDFYPYQAVATEEGLLLSSGTLLTADCVIAATGGIAHDWLQLSHLSLDQSGFISVDSTHRSLSHRNVFAVGDVCSRQDRYIARSGVHAVHAGPILAHNLRAITQGYPLKPYDAKTRSLYLLSCGGRHGVMSWGKFSASGTWVWHWKNHIDKKFIKRFL